MDKVYVLPGSKSNNIWIEKNDAEVGLSEINLSDGMCIVPSAYVVYIFLKIVS